MQALLFAVSLILGASGSAGTKPALPRLLPRSQGSPVVGFAVIETPVVRPGDRAFELIYVRDARPTRVRLSYRSVPVPADPPFASTSVTLAHQDSSDARPLLEALARAHGASLDAAPVAPVKQLVLEAALFGETLAPRADGGSVVAGAFTRDVAEPWIVLKLFLPASANDEAGELFVALNPSEHKGVFLVKDPASWPMIERAFMSVL